MDEILMWLSPSLKSVLKEKSIESYAPAYDGESVGLDLYYAGDEELHYLPDMRHPWTMEHFMEETQTCGVIHGCRKVKEVKLIPTGLHVRIPHGYVGLIMERGSISKTPLIRRAGVVDPGYTDQIYVNLVEPSPHTTYVIKPGDKLPVQLVVVRCLQQFRETTHENFLAQIESSRRKEGKVGSSD